MAPRLPGHLCALGQMLADIRRIEELQSRAEAMRKDAERLLEADGIDRTQHRHTFSLDVRYAGQSFTMPIAWDPSDGDWSPVRREFDARHEETFGYAAVDNDVEVVNVRLVSLGLVEKPSLAFRPSPSAGSQIEQRRAFFGEWIECPVFLRDGLEPGFELQGPAIIEEAGGTSVVPPDWTIEVHASGALIGTPRHAQPARSARASKG